MKRWKTGKNTPQSDVGPSKRNPITLRGPRVYKKVFGLLAIAAMLSGMFSQVAYMEANSAANAAGAAGNDIIQAVTSSGIATNVSSTGILTADGHVLVNGDNAAGLYGINSTTPTSGSQFHRVLKSSVTGDPQPLSGIDRLYATQGAIMYAWDKDAETLYSWGDNGFMRGGVSQDMNSNILVAKEVDFLGAPIQFDGDKAQSLHVTYGTVYVIDKDGKVWSWGQATTANTFVVDFRLGRETAVNSDPVTGDLTETAADLNGNGLIKLTQALVSVVPDVVPYTADPNEKAIAVTGGGLTTNYILTDLGNVYVFGGASISPNPTQRYKKITHPAAVQGRKFVKMSSASGGATILLDDIGQVYTMNETDNTNALSRVQKPPAIYGTPGNPAAAASTFVKVTASGVKGAAAFFATASDGKVYVWGSNSNGISALGLTSGTNASAVLNNNLTGADDFGAITSSGLMLRGHDLYTWGINGAGQLANGTTGSSSGTPAKVLPEYLADDSGEENTDVGPPPAPPLPNPHGADFMINNDRILVDQYAGFGAQYNQALYADITQHEYGTTPQNVGDLEQKVEQLGPQHIRIFYDPDYWLERFYDNKDQSKGTTITDPGAQSFLKTVKLAQDSGNSINVTYWHMLGSAYPDQTDAVQMQTFANLIYDLIVTKGYTAVQELTILNEPNGTNVNFDMARYEGLYRYLDADLRAMGIRDRVKLVGGDLVNTNQQTWLEYLAYKMGDVLDAFSVHIYWNFWDTAYAVDRLNSIRSIMDNSIGYSKHKPIYITEYGVRGYKDSSSSDPRFIDPGASTQTITPETVAMTDMPLDGFQHAWFNMISANMGYVAAVRWDAYQGKYDSGKQNSSLIGKGLDGYPLRPGYYQLQLMTSTSKSGWKVVGAEARDNGNGKVATAMLGPNGEQTFYALNNTSAATSISLGNLTPGKIYSVYDWNKSGDTRNTYEGTVQVDANGMVSVPVQPLSFAAITSLTPTAPITDQPEEAVALAAASVNIGFAAGDSATSVTQNVYLGTAGANGTTVTWSSDAPAVIAADGSVTRPAATGSDTLVTLTATVSKGTSSVARTFAVLVPKREAPPVTTLQLGGTLGAGGWYVTNATATLSATDDKSSVVSTEYALTVLQSVYGLPSTNGFVAYTGPILLSDGSYRLEYRSTDLAGNVEAAHSADIRVDQTAPAVAVTANGSLLADGASILDSQLVTLAAEASDAGSGLAAQTITVDGVPMSNPSVMNWAGKLGVHVIQVVVADTAGNVRTINVHLTVSTSTGSAQQLIARFLGAGELADKLEKKITNKFEQALDQWGKGHQDQAVKHMQDALKELDKAKAGEISANAEQVLRADLNAIIAGWSL